MPKEIIVDFRMNKVPVYPIFTKYMGSIIDHKLNGFENSVNISKKANQRLYFVRRLKKVGVDKSIMSIFYKSTVE